MSKKSKMVTDELLSSLKKGSEKVLSLSGVSSEQNDITLWVVRIVLILLSAVIIPLLPATTLDLLDNTVVRVVLCLLVVFLALFDSASGIIMAVALMVAMQMLNKSRMTAMATNAIVSGGVSVVPTEIVPQKQEQVEKKVTENYADFNLFKQEMGGASVGDSFTTPQQFLDAQSNEVADNQNTEVRTWTNELGPQGISEVMGFSNKHGDLLNGAFPL